MRKALDEARALMDAVTPLAKDCGSLCGGACCQGSDDEGMLLFPGEEAYYENCDWAYVKTTEAGPLLVCRGRCERAERPLGCRIFPLRISMKSGRPKALLDIRAWPLCPLMPYGTKGLSQPFVAAAEAAGQLLCEEEAHRLFLLEEEARVQAYRALSAPFERRPSHVDTDTEQL